MDPESDRSDSSTKVVLIVLGVVGGVLLLCGGGVVVLIVFVATKVSSDGGSTKSGSDPQAEQLVRELMADLAAGRTDAAFSKMQPGIATQVRSEPDLHRILKDKPALRNQTSYSLTFNGGSEDQAAFTLKVQGTSGRPVEVIIDVARQKGVWKVTKFAVF